GPRGGSRPGSAPCFPAAPPGLPSLPAGKLAILSDGAVVFCFCFSSASSIWMRRSIFSSFSSSAWLPSPSAARTLPVAAIDSAVAASSADCQRRFGHDDRTGECGKRCDDIGAPKSAEIGLRDDRGHLTLLKEIWRSERARRPRISPL